MRGVERDNFHKGLNRAGWRQLKWFGYFTLKLLAALFVFSHVLVFLGPFTVFLSCDERRSMKERQMGRKSQGKSVRVKGRNAGKWKERDVRRL